MNRSKSGTATAPINGRGLPHESSGLADAAFDLLMGGETVVGLSGAMGRPRSPTWIESGVECLAAFLRSDEEIPPIMRRALAAAFDGGPVDEYSPNPGVHVKVSATRRRTGWSILDENRKGQIGFDAYEKARAAGETPDNAKITAAETAALPWRDLQPLVAARRFDRMRLAELEQARIDGKSLEETFALINSPPPGKSGRPLGSKKKRT